MRLIAYIRVSTEEQATHGTSLQVQPDQLRRHAAQHGHDVVLTIADEGVSGSVPLAKRKGGAALIAALEAGQADGVLVVRLDRLFRDVIDGVLFFRDTDAAVVSCSELLDTSTPPGRLALHMMLATAQYERDVAQARAVDNARGLREAGRVYGTTPYGCRAVDGRLYRDPGQWAVRERIAILRADGRTYDWIRGWLADEGHPAPAGGCKWSKSTLRAIVETHDQLAHLPLLPDSVQSPAA